MVEVRMRDSARVLQCESDGEACARVSMTLQVRAREREDDRERQGRRENVCMRERERERQRVHAKECDKAYRSVAAYFQIWLSHMHRYHWWRRWSLVDVTLVDGLL